MRSEGLCANTSTWVLRKQLENCEYQKLIMFESHKLVFFITDLKKRYLNIRNLPYTIMWFYRHASILHSVLLLQGYEKQLSKEDDDVSLLDCQIDWFPTLFTHEKYSFNTKYNEMKYIIYVSKSIFFSYLTVLLIFVIKYLHTIKSLFVFYIN